MAVSKVILNGTTIMDVTSATATAGDIASPKTAMIADGVLTTGTGTIGGGGSGPGYGDMELIKRYTVPENSTEVIVNTDTDGNSFQLVHAQIILKVGTPTTSTKDYIRSDLYMHEPNGAITWRSTPTLSLISAGVTYCWMVYTFHTFNGLAYALGRSTSTGNAQNAQQSTYTSTDNNGITEVRNIDYFTAVKFSQYNASSTLIPAGAEIIIYGCRYSATGSGGGGGVATVSVSIPYANWTTSSTNVYSQTVTVTGGDANSKIDLQPDSTALLQLMNDGVQALYISNNNGTFTAYAIGAAPTANLTVQASITAVSS